MDLSQTSPNVALMLMDDPLLRNHKHLSRVLVTD